MKLYFSTNGGETWQEADCSISNQRSNGVTVRTFTPKETVSTTEYRVEFSKNTTLLELEMNTRIPTFYVGEQATLATVKGNDPVMPEKAVVYYSNGEVARRSVEWDLSKVSFDKAGVVKVTGKVGKSQAEASVRVEEAPENMSQTTPLGKNFALNEDGISKSKE